jgi:transposase-like protein
MAADVYKNVMKPICPHCGRPMTLAKATADRDAQTNFRSYRCKPCGYVFSEVVAVYDVAERAMMLDLEASAQLSAIN